MSIIIRLQNLPLEANSLDIRRFFQGLHIPDGGVHIVGGENGDAFIAFGTDEDARQAMERNGNLIKGSRIKLLLSSRNEMQRVIESARTQTFGVINVPGKSPVQQTPATQQPNVPYHSQYSATPSAGQLPPVKQLPSVEMKNTNSIPPYSAAFNPQAGSNFIGAGGGGLGVVGGLPPAKPHDPFQHASNAPYQRRSRSRSRSPPNRARIDNVNETNSSLASTMHSGLIGSMQSASYGQNGSYNNNNNVNNAPPVSYDNSNMPPRNYAAPYGTKKYSPDDHWNAPHSNVTQPPPSVMPNVSQPNMPNDNYWQTGQGTASGGDMYRKMDNAGPASGGLPPHYNQMSPPGQPYGQGMNEPVMPMSQGAPPPTQQPQPNRMFTLQVWNLPLSVRPRDLIDFFVPLRLIEENVQLFYDEKGFATGIALVRFPTPREFDQALQNNGKPMQGRQIQIRPLDDMNGSNPPPPTPSMDNSVNGPPSQPVDNYRQDNYGAYRNSPSSQNESFNRQSIPPYQTPPLQPPNKDLVVFMKGLPYSSCTKADVAAFFKPIPLLNIEIEMERGKPTGNAFVEFKNRTDFEHGMEYNMRHMGRRYIELIPLLKMDNKFGPPPRYGPPSGRDFSENNGRVNFCVSVKGLSPNVTSNDLKMFFGDIGATPYAVHIMMTPDRFNAGEAFLEFVEKSQQDIALDRNGDFMGRDRLMIRPVPYEVVKDVRQPPPGPPHSSRPDFYRGAGGDTKNNRDKYRDKERGGGGGGRGGRHHHPSTASGPPPLPRNGSNPFQDKSCILSAFNISIKATDDDLCVFFSDYHITSERIRRRIDEKSNTIEAQISFYNRADVERAYRTLDKKYFLGRTIQLKLLN